MSDDIYSPYKTGPPECSTLIVGPALFLVFTAAPIYTHDLNNVLLHCVSNDIHIFCLPVICYPAQVPKLPHLLITG